LTDKIKSLGAALEEYSAYREGAVTIKYDESLSRHTTFRIGGNADLYLIPHSVDALVDVIRTVRDSGVKFYVLGNGSNVLFDDAGFSGAVISTSGLVNVKVDGDAVTADAGATLASVCKAARDSSLEGLEFAYGIPGSVGGAVFMNAGAYGGEMAHVLRESTYLDLDDLSVYTITNAEHNYGYRESVYKHTRRVILSATFELKAGIHDEISEKMNDFMNRRVTKQPLEFPSAGSVFKRYPGRYTGQMIEEAGLKGYTIGGAQVSEKHAGFIINIGGATADDVNALIRYIKEKILEIFGCELECEMIYIKNG